METEPAAVEPAPSPVVEPDGVVIQVTYNANGDATITGVAPLGTVRATEIPTILAFARKMIEDRLGIG